MFNCATVVLLTLASVFALAQMSSPDMYLDESRSFWDGEHPLPEVAFRVDEELAADGITYQYEIQAEHTQLPRASQDETLRENTVTFASPPLHAALKAASVSFSSSPSPPPPPPSLAPAYVLRELRHCPAEDPSQHPDDFLAAQIHHYYCLPPSALMIQGTFGSPLYQYVKIDLRAKSLNSPATGLSFAMRVRMPESQSDRTSRWESLYYNGQPGMPHIKAELFFSDVLSIVVTKPLGCCPSHWCRLPTLSFRS